MVGAITRRAKALRQRQMVKIIEQRYHRQSVVKYREAVYESTKALMDIGLDEEETVAWLQDSILEENKKRRAENKGETQFQERLIRLWVHRVFSAFKL